MISTQRQTNQCSFERNWDCEPDNLYIYNMHFLHVDHVLLIFGTELAVLVPQKFVFWRESLKTANLFVSLQISMEHDDWKYGCF